MWPELQQMETGLSNLTKEMLKISHQKSRKWPTKPLYIHSWSMLQLFRIPTLKTMPIRLKWSRDAQPGGPRMIMPERLASLHCYTSWTGKHLRRDNQWPVSVSFTKIVIALMAVLLPDYIQPTHRISRYCHSMTFRQIHTGKDSFK